MSSTWEPSPLELDGYACRHIEYEVRMLTQQCEALEARWSSVQTGRAVMGADGQALVEAVLVHLRLLDDFLGGRESSHDDVFALHWDEAWEPCRVLPESSDARERVNAKVAHLTGRRSDLGDWDPAELVPLVRYCCEVLRGVPR